MLHTKINICIFFFLLQHFISGGFSAGVPATAIKPEESAAAVSQNIKPDSDVKTEPTAAAAVPVNPVSNTRLVR